MNFVSVVKYLRISRAVVMGRAEAQLLLKGESNPTVLITPLSPSVVQETLN